MRLKRGVPALAAACLLLSGCKDLSMIAGIATGSATGAATANPALGFAVGVGVSAAGDFISHYYDKVRTGAEQDVIAEAAGPLAVGQKAPWRIRHTIPIGNEHGVLFVTGVITTKLAVCKEVVFSVDGDPGAAVRPWYTVDVCRAPRGWKWATAEPAVPRWGALQ